MIALYSNKSVGMEAIDIDHSLVVDDEFDALYVQLPNFFLLSPLRPKSSSSSSAVSQQQQQQQHGQQSSPSPSSIGTHSKMASNVDHHTFRCKTRGLLHSAVSAAVAVVFSIPFMSRLPLTDVVGRRSVEVNVAELDASKANENVRKFPGK